MHGYTGEGVSRPVDPVDKPTPSSKKSAQIPLRSPLPSSFAAGDGETPSETATDGSEDAADDASVPLSNRVVNVSSGVMAANLLSGPEPSSPMLASLTRMKGKVVMEAVISKDGTVESLHVIQGHRLLRGAAKDAVRSWRYRPYKIDGVPVDVATIVSVDFDRHR
jgi:TonB family protein